MNACLNGRLIATRRRRVACAGVRCCARGYDLDGAASLEAPGPILRPLPTSNFQPKYFPTDGNLFWATIAEVLMQLIFYQRLAIDSHRENRFPSDAFWEMGIYSRAKTTIFVEWVRIQFSHRWVNWESIAQRWESICRAMGIYFAQARSLVVEWGRLASGKQSKSKEYRTPTRVQPTFTMPRRVRKQRWAWAGQKGAVRSSLVRSFTAANLDLRVGSHLIAKGARIESVALRLHYRIISDGDVLFGVVENRRYQIHSSDVRRGPAFRDWSVVGQPNRNPWFGTRSRADSHLKPQRTKHFIGSCAWLSP
ncbi:hypothetical protein Pan181_28430 [Aeoliella mucimassa]|uniref:Uncharacterized protein n=1 Tax=Aeoliella mucimassa TaxID=2527972 RepID=A0A518APH8_9BACT|nr:hypothetical protein Pan181_28430 [Aeoliella mucimassa]